MLSFYLLSTRIRVSKFLLLLFYIKFSAAATVSFSFVCFFILIFEHPFFDFFSVFVFFTVNLVW